MPLVDGMVVSSRMLGSMVRQTVLNIFRRKRLEITKQVQERNRELQASEDENTRINEELKVALHEAENSKNEALVAKDAALNDLDIIQKKSQTELIGTIVKVALLVIISVGIITTIMYGIAMMTGKDTQIIGSTWSNMFGILLTNAFSIVGTIMGVKYASENKNN
jgi:ABC-type multidrug transport system fused ATPase/permease subunit